MGLDMYLYKKHHTKNYDYKGADHTGVSVTTNGEVHPDIRPERVAYVLEEVVYWRKVNQVHGWFVDNVQEGNDNGATYHVEREQLERLRDTAKEVLANRALAAEKLPVREGCFFGTYDYDQFYFSDLESTVAELDAVLDEPNYGATFAYHASW